MKGIDRIVTHTILICVVLDIVLAVAAISVASGYPLLGTTDTTTNNVVTKDINYERRDK